MNTEEKLFRDVLEKSLGKYCPNITALNQISTYLFREAVGVIKNSGDVNKVLSETESNTDIETLSFIRAIKDLSTFSSQVVINEAFKKAFQDVKNTIPLVERKEVIEKSSKQITSHNTTSVKTSGLSKNIAEFDIDIESIPKVTVQQKPDIPMSRNESVSNVFTGDFDIDLDDVNQRTVRHNVSDDDSEEYQDFTTDGSAFSEEVYSDSFSIDTGLDY